MLSSRGGLIAFVLILAWQLPLQHQGFDAIDVGFHLTSQLMVIEHGAASVLFVPFDWLSNAVGGWWLQFVGLFDLGLYGARLGGALLIAATGSVATIMVTHVFGRHWLVPLGVVAVSFYVESSRFYIINYTTVPASLSVVFAYVYALLIREKSVRAHSIFMAVLVGVLMAMLFFAKITLVLVIVVPIVGIIIMAGFGHPHLRSQIVLSVLALATFAALMMVFFLGLWTFEVLETYLKLLAGQGKTHGVGRMLALIPRGWWFWLPLCTVSLVYSYAAAMLRNQGKPPRRTISLAYSYAAAMLRNQGKPLRRTIDILRVRPSVRVLALFYACVMILALPFVLYDFEKCGFSLNLKGCGRWHHFLEFWFNLTLVAAAVGLILRGRGLHERFANFVDRLPTHHRMACLALGLGPAVLIFYPLVSGWEIFLVLGVAATCTLLLALKPPDKRSAKNDLMVMAWVALALPFVNGLGSGAGLSKMTYGLWLLAALLPILIREIVGTAPFSKWKTSIYFGSVAFLMASTISGWQQAYGYVFGDDNDRSKLTYELQSPRLSNIHTTSGRRQSFDALISAVRSMTSDGDKILAYNYLSMVHFSANSRPLYLTGWSVLNGISPIYYADLDKTLCVTRYPKIIVRTLTITFSENWGLNPDTRIYNVIFEDDYKYTYDVVDKIVFRNCDPQVVWENPDFQILVPIVSAERIEKSSAKPGQR